MNTLKITLPQPKVSKSQGREALFCISRKTLCHQTLNPTAYRRSDGKDAKSLTAIINGCNPNLLSVSFDAESEIANINIDWTLFKMNRAKDNYVVKITGNHNTSIEVKVQILYPVKTPALVLESKNGTAIWGTNNPCDLIIKGKEDVGHESWQYLYKTKVFVAKVEGFYIDGLNTVQYAGTTGYMVSLNQWERKIIKIKYNYENTCINQAIEKKIPIIYIYYTTDSAGREVKKKETPDYFKVKFTPLKPIISLSVKRLQNEYVLGTKNINIFEVTISKQDFLAQDFVNLSLSSTDSRVIVSKSGDFNYVVSVNSTAFRDIPDKNITIELNASATNANDACCNLILTKGCLNGENSVELKKQTLLSITDSSEIKGNSPIILYAGNTPSIFSLSIMNISSRVLRAGIELREINLEINSNFGVSFKNGRTKEKISRLQDLAFSTVGISIKPDQAPSTKDFNIVVTADYSNPLVIPIKVQTKKKILPRIEFEFSQEKELFCRESVKFNPIRYENERIGTITISSVAEGDLSSYAIFSLKDNPLYVSESSKISIISNNEYFSEVNDELTFNVYFSGELGSHESFVVSCGHYSTKIELAVCFKFYNLPQIIFDALNDNQTYQYEKVERIFIGTLKSLPIDTEERENVDYSIILPEAFCFEDDVHEKAFNGLFNEEKVFILPNSIFGDVENIKKSQQIPLVFKMSSPVLAGVMKTPEGDSITITPIKAEANPFIDVKFEKDPDGNGNVKVSYTEVWLEDEKNRICEVLVGNNSLLHYSPREDVDNDFVEFSNIRICGDDDLIVFDDPGRIIIENGSPSYAISVYLDCKKWDGRKKTISFSCMMDVQTASKTWKDKKDIFTIELKENRNDKIFSLDLGTTGIVMAKQDDYEISTIQLQDAGESKTFHIERDKCIISSLAIIYKEAINESNCHQILLSPTRTDYKNDAKFIFVPAKFVVGQKRIPYTTKILTEVPLVVFDTVATKRIEKVSDDCIFSLDANRNEELLTPELYLQLIYDNVLNRIGEEKNNIKKLILTYPNTYTQTILEQLRQVVEDKFNDLFGFVDMVPESDAVVAFYFNSRLNCFSEDTKIKEKRAIKVGEERILIYDMGAGTLDLSLVTITRHKGKSRITANIEKKIGIPIAGNYLDWTLYDKFFRHHVKSNDDNDQMSEIEKEEQEYKILKNLKDYIKQLKEQYSSVGMNILLPKDDADTCLDSEFVKCLKDDSKSNEFATKFSSLDDSIQDFISLCSTTILEIFLGKQKVDRLVYSGRGSQFGPLRSAVENYLRQFNENLIIDDTIENNNLKTCVAEGAIHYYDMFGSDVEHSITNRNQHLNLGVVYIAPKADGSGNEVHYKEIIHPDDGLWSDYAENQDGTWWREFENTVTVDLSVQNKKVFFIQSLLDEEKIKVLYSNVYSNPNMLRDDVKWVFVNELFVFNTKQITQQHREKIEIRVKIDKENNIQYSVGGRHPKGEKLVDNIEGNIFYQRSMWPYIEF